MNAYTAITGGLSFTPQYDDNGNMLNDNKHTYTYDWNNKQVGMDDGVVTVKYDALGRRIAKNATIYYYIGDQMVEEYTDGQLAVSYLYGNDIDEALQMKRGPSVYYYHTNHLGSTMALSDAAGAIVERVDYDAYGQPTFFDADGNVISQSSIGNTILFTAREYNIESETYFYRARSMHPNVGRFMQKDPLGYIDGMNIFVYVSNLPVLYRDKYGTTEKSNPNIVDINRLVNNSLLIDLDKGVGCDYSSFGKTIVRPKGDKTPYLIGPYDSVVNEVTYCDKYPLICLLKSLLTDWYIEVGVNLCFIGVEGSCGNPSFIINIDGITRVDNIIEGYGLLWGASINASVGLNFDRNFTDTTSDIWGGSATLIGKYGANYSSSKDDYFLSGAFGVDVGAGKKSGYVGTGLGGELGAFYGKQSTHYGKTKTWGSILQDAGKNMRKSHHYFGM